MKTLPKIASVIFCLCSVTLVLHADAIPVLEGALDLAAANVPGGGRTNQAHFGSRVALAGSISAARSLIFFDPQTSGGLLMTVAPEAAAGLVAGLAASGENAHVIGRVEAPDPAGTLVRFV